MELRRLQATRPGGITKLRISTWRSDGTEHADLGTARRIDEAMSQIGSFGREPCVSGGIQHLEAIRLQRHATDECSCGGRHRSA